MVLPSQTAAAAGAAAVAAHFAQAELAMLPPLQTGAVAAPFAQVLPDRIIVKNTFLEVQEEYDSDAEWRKDGGRDVKTCPGFLAACAEQGSDLELPPRHESAPFLLGRCGAPPQGEWHTDLKDVLNTFEREQEEDATEARPRARRTRARGGRRHQRAVAEEAARDDAHPIAAVPAEAPSVRGQASEQRNIGERQRTRASRGGKDKLWCQLYINPDMLRPGFDLNKKIIGREGSCTKGIFTATGAKVRLRGQGSGFNESPCHGRSGGLQEAQVPLMLSIATDRGESDNFRRAVAMAVEHLRSIGDRFAAFCSNRSHPTPTARRG